MWFTINGHGYSVRSSYPHYAQSGQKVGLSSGLLSTYNFANGMGCGVLHNAKPQSSSFTCGLGYEKRPKNFIEIFHCNASALIRE